MNNMGRKKVAVWPQVSKYVEQLSTDSFDLHDLALILTIWPKCIQLDWRVIALDSLSPPEMNLCLTFPSPVPLVKSADNGETLQRENRVEVFKRKLQQHTSNDKEYIVAEEGVIPEKCDPVVGHKNTAGAMSSAVKAIKISAALGAALPVTSHSMYGTINVDPKASIPSMDKLFKMAQEREKEAAREACHLADEKKRSQAEQRLNALPALCDSLRSLSKAKKHQSCPVLADDVMNDICRGATVQVGDALRTYESPTKHEMLARLQIIARELPEFLTLYSPDSVLPHHTLTVHLAANYAEVRRKIVMFVRSAMNRLNKKFGQYQ